MEEKKLFRYVDTVILSGKMMEALISGEDSFRRVGTKSIHRSGFMALAGMAAVVCAMVIAGYVFLINDNAVPPEIKPTDIYGGVSPVGENDYPSVTTAASPHENDVHSFIPAPANPHPDRDWWYFNLWSIEYILDFYDSLKYHADFTDFVPRFIPIFSDVYNQGEIPHERIAGLIRLYLSNPGDEVLSSAINSHLCTLEQFVFDFLDYIKMPDEQIPYLFDISWTALTGEWVRENEINSLYLALNMARAFVEGDADYLSRIFYSYYSTNGLFDFAIDLKFNQFTLTRTEFDPNNNDFLHYFTISTSDELFASRNPFTGGTAEWILATDGYAIRQFSPAHLEEMKRINRFNEHSDIVTFCYNYSSFVDFISEYNDYFCFQGLYITLLTLYTHEQNQSEQRAPYFETDRFIELVNYVFGIEIDRQVLEQAGMLWQDGERVYLSGRGFNTTTAELVYESYSFFPPPPRIEISESESDQATTVIINYYGDLGYMFLSRTVEYELEFGELGWRLVSVKNIFEDPHINVSFYHP
jgi:hypothetical protein